MSRIAADGEDESLLGEQALAWGLLSRGRSESDLILSRWASEG
jgi:hypothetical protein